MLTCEIATQRREEMIDITATIAAVIASASWLQGAVMLFCPHTTCGLTINEGADPAVRQDIMRFFRQLAPRNGSWAHAEGNTDAHIRASLLGASLLLPLDQGQIALGRWQSVYLYEGDGPRRRQLWLTLLQAGALSNRS
ncbi:MAG: YjbQ family protein [Desulfovibrio sp.]|nr:YjbQ family protein [Desulfovibrio sp.]